MLGPGQAGTSRLQTLVKTGVAIVAGEVTTEAWVDRRGDRCAGVIVDIGYTSSQVGFDGRTCGVLNIIGKQSPTSRWAWTARIPRSRVPATRA